MKPHAGRWWRAAAVATLVIGGVVLFWGRFAELAAQMPSQDDFRDMVGAMGLFGPVLVIGLMCLAVVASPIPSAPIALAAGAAYGHFEGAILVLIGAEAGAMAAFFIARKLGRDALVRWFGDKADAGFLGSQNALMFTVFASRLMPFVSFDAISYAAGLSCLSFSRFALATLAGIAPASFVLAHLGATAFSGDPRAYSLLALGLGIVTGGPLLVIAARRFSARVHGDGEKN